MRTITTLLATPLILILGISTAARAQDRHAVPPSALAAAVADHAATLDADRDAIREALNRPEVRAVAERTGNLLCQDTGIPIYNVTIGRDALVDGVAMKAAIRRGCV